MRPVVKTALRRFWRDPTTLQIGVHPDRALVLGGVAAPTAELFAALDGTRDQQELRTTAASLGLAADEADRLIALLADASVLDDAGTDAGPLNLLGHDERDRLAPDLASMSLVSGCLDGGVSAMHRRQGAVVGVVGAGRVGATVATLLAAAGVGHLVVDDPETCRVGDCSPAGAALVDTGASRSQAAHAAVHRVSRSVRTSALRNTERFDVVVLAPPGALAPQVHEQLLRSGTPHLLATVRETTGVVGPFVVPGRTACLRCLDLHRTDRDPAWPFIAAQLSAHGRRRPIEACDVGLATFIASVTSLQVLAAIDAGRRPGTEPHSTASPPIATHDGTLELSLPDWRLRRRRWRPHPACGCQWPVGGSDATTAHPPQ